MNHGDRYGVPKPLAGISKAESAAKDDSRRWALQMLLGLPTMAQSHDSQTFTSVRQEPKPMPSPTWPTVSDSAKVVEKHDDHKLPYTDNVPIGLSTIYIALLTFAMTIVNRVRRHLRPSAFLASNDASEFGRSSAWAANTVELRPQGLHSSVASMGSAPSISEIRGTEPWVNVEAVETGSMAQPSTATHKGNSRRNGWNYPSHFSVCASTVCFAEASDTPHDEYDDDGHGFAKAPDLADDEYNDHDHGNDLQPDHDHVNDLQQPVSPMLSSAPPWLLTSLKKKPESSQVMEDIAKAEAMLQDFRRRVDELEHDVEEHIEDLKDHAMHASLRNRVEELRQQEIIDAQPDFAWVLMYQGEDSWGIHALSSEEKEGEGVEVILLFEAFEEAQRFGLVLHAQGFFEPSPRYLEVAQIQSSFMEGRNIAFTFIPKGVCILPPDGHATDF
jgi:hypothetical protein